MLLIGASPMLQAYSQSDFFGKCIFLGLFILSLISWVLLVYKIKTFNKAQKLSHAFYAAYSKMRHQPLHIEWNPRLDVRGICFYFNMYKFFRKKSLELLRKNQQVNTEKALLFSPDIEAISSYMDSSIIAEKKRLSNNLFILATIMSLAPFLGLLGTVWGILMTLSQIPSSAAGNSEAVLGGISMALGTTILGLLVAIPALIAYNYLKQKIHDITCDMDQFASDMLTSLDIHYRQVEMR